MIDEKYHGDARRTVNFQDLPGKQWSMGYVSFQRLLRYTYDSKTPEYNAQNNKSNYQVIVIRPKGQKDTRYDPEKPDEISLVSKPKTITTQNGHYISGNAIKPEFILGMFRENQGFVRNPNCDIEKVAEMSPKIEAYETAKKERIQEEAKLRKEIEEAQISKKETSAMREFLGKIADKIKGLNLNNKDKEEGGR